MYPTVEVRWFYPGQVPAKVEAWFQQGAGRVERPPCREDHYLRLTDPQALGIKLREGRIEVKKRVREHGVVRFHKRVTGIVEHWRKWGFQLAEAHRALSSIAVPTTSWIRVSKERMLRTYRLTVDKCVVPVSASELPRQGCELELSRVHVAGQDWWTLAFEAFGDESVLQEQFVLVTQHVFAAEESPSLSAPESRGYADWLGRVARKQETV
ncbi:MAG: hypothetical protein PVG71_01580 [Anaerolineae bacterium]|jgi:hypothetical protein